MNPEVIVAILGTGGFSAIVGAVVTGVFSKRKMGAEATEIITKAAAGVVTSMQSEIDRQVKLNDELVEDHKAALARMEARHTAEMDEVRRVLQLHVAWDSIAIARMSEVGITLPPVPPLLPDRRLRVGEEG